jgi:hypothetical protein
MDLTRRVAVRLARDGVLRIEQRKTILDPDQWDKAGRPGICRLRLAGGA